MTGRREEKGDGEVEQGSRTKGKRRERKGWRNEKVTKVKYT